LLGIEITMKKLGESLSLPDFEIQKMIEQANSLTEQDFISHFERRNLQADTHYFYSATTFTVKKKKKRKKFLKKKKT